MDRKRSFRSPPSGLPKRNDSIFPELVNFSLKKDLQKSSSKNVKLFDPIRESTQSEFKEESTTNEYGDYISISQFSVAPKQQSKSNSLSRSKSVSIRTPSLDDKNDKIITSVSTNDHASPWRLLKTKLALIPNLPTLDLNKENIRASSITPKKRFTLYNIHRQESVKDEIVTKDIYEPTYRLEPVNKFDRHKAEDIIHDAIKYFLENIFSVESMALKSSVKTSIEHLSTTIKSVCIKFYV